MAPLTDCPGIECWQALFSDTLPPDQREPYERHLEACPACQDHLDGEERCGDALTKLVHRVGDPTAASLDPTLVQVLKRLSEEGFPSRNLTPDSAELYFLRPTDRPGLLGLLGEYEVREVIGQGGMGIVLKAFEPALQREVAIKVLAPGLAGSTTARRRFNREGHAAAAVCHDYIVPVYAVHEAEGLPFLVMQYIAGESLQERLDRTGPLAVDEAVRLGQQTAAGLAAAHAHGLIHRDIKPANLLLEDGSARAKITDFGLARLADDMKLTQHGVLAGTPEYMAPEQARGEPLDQRADLFSLGSVLYAMCTGQPPFCGATAVAVLRRLHDEAPAPPRSLNPDVPVWLEALVARLMAKDPANRFQTAAEVADLLQAYLLHLQQPATVPPPEFAPLQDASATLEAEQLGERRIWGILTFSFGLLIWLSLAALVAIIAPQALAKKGDNVSLDLSEDRGGHRWLHVALALSVVLVLSSALWLFVRRRRGNGPQKDKTPSAATSVLFVCMNCAKKLKTKAESVGKKVKCPACGKVVRVPETKPGSLAPKASRGRFSILKNRWVRTSLLVLAVVAGVCSWHFLTRREKSSFLNVTLGNQVVADVSESGFSFQEYDDHGEPFRWTNGKARLVIPIDRRTPPTGLVVNLEIYRPQHVKTVWVQIVANNRDLLKEHVALSKWEANSVGRVNRAFDLTGIDLGDELVLDIMSDTFNPRGVMENGTNIDPRALGLLVRSLELLASLDETKMPGAATARTIDTPRQIWPAHPQGIVGGALSADGKTLVSGGRDGTIKIWDVAAHRERETLPGFAPNLQTLAVSPDGKTFATAGLDRVADVWDMETLELQTALAGHGGQVTGLAYSPDGKTLAVAGGDRFKTGELKLWDTTTGAGRLPGVYFNLRLEGVAFAADGKSVAVTGGDRTAQMVDVNRGTVLAAFALPAYGSRVALSPDGTLLAVAFGNKGEVNVREVNGGKLAAVFQSPTRKQLSSLEFSHDGKRLIAGSDRSATLWDLGRPRDQATTTLVGHEGEVRFATFFPDGQTVATGGQDGTIRLWNVGRAGDAALPLAKKLKEYFYSFKDHRSMDPNFDWEGLDPQQCVKFEPAGLHIILPAGHQGKRVATGVATTFPIKGDFEITMSYEIIKAPEPQEGGVGTGLSLCVDLDSPEFKRAIVTRAAATTGRLRLVRTGTVLSHYAADGYNGAFALLRQHSYGTEDVKKAVLGGQTGGPQASLEFRVTDVRIRAESLPEFVEAAETEASGAVDWLLIASVGSLALLLALGGWFIIRRRRLAAQTSVS